MNTINIGLYLVGSLKTCKCNVIEMGKLQRFEDELNNYNMK